MFLEAILILILVKGNLMQNSHAPELRIVGGERTEIEKYPYQVFIGINVRNVCGGSIISKYSIVTAGHCIPANVTPKIIENSAVFVGSNCRWEGEKYGVKNMIAHPKLVRKTFENDIGLIFLKISLLFSSSIRPIEIAPTNYKLRTGSMVTFTGWGRAKREEGLVIHKDDNPNEVFVQPRYLRSIDLPIVDHNVCKSIYKKIQIRITNSMICAGFLDRPAKTPCTGDSGGPVVQNGKLVGVTSWVSGKANGYENCGLNPGYPSVQASIMPFRRWILNQISLYESFI